MRSWGKLVGLLALAGFVLAGCGSAVGLSGDTTASVTTGPVVAGAASADEPTAGEPLPKIDNPTLADVMTAGPLPERTLGRADAPVTMIEYVSLTCPYCRAFHEKVLAEIKRDYIDKGRVRLIVREFPIGKTAGAATIVNRCIGENKYFALLHRFLVEQRTWVSQEVRRDAIFEVARKEGMTRPQFDACFDDKAVVDGLKWVKERGRRLGVAGTPTFFVQNVKLRTSPSAEDIRRALDQALQRPAGAPIAGTAAR